MISILYTCFNTDSGVIDAHLRTWSEFSPFLRQHLHFLLIDDCSDRVLDPVPPAPLRLTVARVLEDRGWNNAGAKNLGFRLAREGWVFQSDIDHSFDAGAARRLVEMEKDVDKIYRPHRSRIDRAGVLEEIHPHENTFLIHRGTFWQIGGYDEDFSGHYGYEDVLFRNVSEGRWAELEDVTVTAHVTWSTAGVVRDASRNEKLYKKKLKELKRGLYRNGMVLRFRWEITSEHHFESADERDAAHPTVPEDAAEASGPLP